MSLILFQKNIWYLVVDVEAIEEKTTRKIPDRVRPSIVALSAETLEKNKIVTLDVYSFTAINFLSSSV